MQNTRNTTNFINMTILKPLWWKRCAQMFVNKGTNAYWRHLRQFKQHGCRNSAMISLRKYCSETPDGNLCNNKK